MIEAIINISIDTMTEIKSTLLVDEEVTNIDRLIEVLGEDYAVHVATGGTCTLDGVKEVLPDMIPP